MYTHTVGLNQLNRPIKEEGPFNLPQALNKQNTDIRRAVFGLPAFQPLYLKHGGMPKDYMKKGGKPKGYGAKGPVMMTPKGKDNVPVMMQEDEYVLPAKAVKKMGGAKKLDKKVEKMTGHRPGKMMKGKTNYAQYGLSPEEELLKKSYGVGERTTVPTRYEKPNFTFANVPVEKGKQLASSPRNIVPTGQGTAARNVDFRTGPGYNPNIAPESLTPKPQPTGFTSRPGYGGTIPPEKSLIPVEDNTLKARLGRQSKLSSEKLADFKARFPNAVPKHQGEFASAIENVREAIPTTRFGGAGTFPGLAAGAEIYQSSPRIQGQLEEARQKLSKQFNQNIPLQFGQNNPNSLVDKGLEAVANVFTPEYAKNILAGKEPVGLVKAQRGSNASGYGATETPEKRNVASFTPAYTGTGENERVFPGARGGVETVPIPKTQTDRRIYGPGGVDLGENPTQAEIDKYIGGGAAKDSELERYKKYLNAQADAQQRADLAASFRQATELQNSGQVLPGAVPLNYGAAFEPSRQNVELNIAQGRQATDIANQTAANALEQRKLAQRQQEFQQSPNAQLTVAAKDLYDIERNPEVAKILADENDTSEYANAVRNRVITLRDLVERLKKGSTSSFGAY